MPREVPEKVDSIIVLSRNITWQSHVSSGESHDTEKEPDYPSDSNACRHHEYGSMMQRSRYNYTTPDGVTVKVVAFREQGEAIRVFVSIDPEDEAKLSDITTDLWDRLPED